MIRKVKACTALVALIIIVVIVNNTNALPIQYLPEVPGYIPVYIRYGDQPLEEINPMLAEAFHESTGVSKSIGANRLDESASENTKKNLIHRNEVGINSNEKGISKDNGPTHVLPLIKLISALSEDQKESKSGMQENESIVEKLSEYLPLENIEVKIIMDDQIER